MHGLSNAEEEEEGPALIWKKKSEEEEEQGSYIMIESTTRTCRKWKETHRFHSAFHSLLCVQGRGTKLHAVIARPQQLQKDSSGVTAQGLPVRSGPLAIGLGATSIWVASVLF